MPKQMRDKDKGEFLTKRTPVKINRPIAISMIPDNVSKKLQKLPRSICFISPVLVLLNRIS
jgi:hypothetical protein